MENLHPIDPTAKMIFDGVTDHAIIRTDVLGNICDWNAGAENVLDYKKEEMIGKNIAEIFTPEDREHHLDKVEMKLAVKNGKSEDKRWHLKKHGIRFYGNGIMNPLKDEKDHLIGFVKILSDETSKHQYEVLLKETQEHLQLALRSAHMGLWSINLQTNEITLSSELIKLFELDEDEKDIYRLFKKLVYPSDKVRSTRILENAIKFHTPYSDEFRIINSAGHMKWVLSRGSTNINSSGIPVFSGVALDVTHSKEIEESLQDIKERFDAATMSSKVGVWEYNIKSNTAWRSLSHDFLHGYKEAVKDWSLEIALSHVHKDDKEKFEHTLKEAIAQKQEWSIEYRIIWPDQSVHWILAVGHTLLDDKGEPSKVMGTSIDITKRKMAEKELEKTVEQLQNERDLRDRFVATLSHDLRTPLTAAKIGAQIVSRKVANEPDLLRTTHKISANMDRVDRMIRDLLDVSSIRAGQPLILKPEKIELRSMFQEIIDEMSTVYGDRFILLGDTFIVGTWDPDAIKRILENLLSNAIKYGSQNKKVTVTLKNISDTAQFHIHNEGNPIPQEYRAHLFEQFRRAETAKTGEQKGWGLGLALVKGFVDAHKGNINVNSSTEAGTTFTITLPKHLE